MRELIERLHGLAKKIEHRQMLVARTLREAAAALEAAREDAELSRAIERAAKGLAPGWEIVIGVEKDAAWIEVFDWDGDQHEFSPDYTFAETIDAAIDQARGKSGPEAGQGGGE